MVCIILLGCSADHAMKKGDKYYALGEYFDAAAQYRKAYAQTPTKERKLRGQRALKLADCYRRINYTQRAIAAYRNALRYGQQDSLTQLYLGQQLMKNASYKEAGQVFDLMLVDSVAAQSPAFVNMLAQIGKRSSHQAPIWKQEGSRYTVKRENIFNSRRAEYSPVLGGENNDRLYFTSTRNEATGDELSGITGTKNGDIFVSQEDEQGKWQRPQVIDSELNTPEDEGACCLTPDGHNNVSDHLSDGQQLSPLCQDSLVAPFGCCMDQSTGSGNQSRHLFTLCAPCRQSRWQMALLRQRHAWWRRRKGHLARASFRSIWTGWRRESWSTHQHSWRRAFPHFPSQW